MSAVTTLLRTCSTGWSIKARSRVDLALELPVAQVAGHYVESSPLEATQVARTPVQSRPCRTWK